MGEAALKRYEFPKPPPLARLADEPLPVPGMCLKMLGVTIHKPSPAAKRVDSPFRVENHIN
jgi:hypothetical protein